MPSWQVPGAASICCSQFDKWAPHLDAVEMVIRPAFDKGFQRRLAKRHHRHLRILISRSAAGGGAAHGRKMAPKGRALDNVIAWKLT
jgi:hypothetical protein